MPGRLLRAARAGDVLKPVREIVECRSLLRCEQGQGQGDAIEGGSNALWRRLGFPRGEN